jgi:phospholipid/cholesterol/gamma-HCH transport system substrate-binding protein
MRRHRPFPMRLLTNVTFLGTLVLLVAMAGMYVSYNATKGLPFVPRYDISVDVPDAAQLTRGVSEVRIGGLRVGLVKDVRPMPGPKPFARLELSLDKRLEALPADSVVRVRPRSILGAKYLDLTPGHAKTTIPAGGILPLEQAKPAFEFDDAFRVFDSQTRNGIRRAVRGLGDGLAGRGTDLNAAIGAFRALLPPGQRVLDTLADPGTNLAGLIDGAAQTAGALAPVAPQLGSLVDAGATTLKALDDAGGAFGDSIDQTPPTEAVAFRTLADAQPVLDDAQAIAHDLRAGTPLLPATTTRLNRAIDATTPLLGDVHRTKAPAQLGRALDALAGLSTNPARRPAIEELIATVTSVKTTLDVLGPAQEQCNVAGLFTRNVSEATSGADTSGGWLNALVIFDDDLSSTSLTNQSPAPSPRLHSNPYPAENRSECEAGNEPWLPGQHIGNVPGNQANTTAETKP